MLTARKKRAVPIGYHWRVRELKENLLKEEAPPRILEILKHLYDINVDLTILQEMLIGIPVSKLKKNSNEDVASAARKLVKKWKAIAEQKQDNIPASK